MAKALKAKGLGFVGPTICYAFMQSVGMVNDHTEDCWRFSVCKELQHNSKAG
jgi:DNA-3-methyladenine glycosylase I